MNKEKYKVTIGLEIHAELKTETKMFCNSKNDADEKRPNVNICPVCMAHPGTLPVINKEAIKHVLRVGVAVKGKIADYTEFDRKNYFYPDIPKGYQISQYKYPLISGGNLAGVEITRIHLEEDTARSSHLSAQTGEDEYSLIDFNRAGVPLMELVTEPVIKSGEQAVKFAKELQTLVRYLNVSDANMEKGEMRVEANISVSKTKDLGTKVEIKNLNSFKVVGKAIDYEINRQIELIESGGEVLQETRGWNENKQNTFSQRKKESSEDYRYFPEPDLPKLKISEIDDFNKGKLVKELPELPWEKRERYKKEYGIKKEDIEIYIVNKKYADLFESSVAYLNDNKNLIKLLSNYITSDVMGIDISKRGKASQEPACAGREALPLKEEWKITPENFAKLIKMIDEDKISSRGAKDILSIMYTEGGNPEIIGKEKKLLQISDEDEMKRIVEKIISENKKVFEDYKKGKDASLKFLVGQGMKFTNGSANPNLLEKLIKKNVLN